MNELNNDVNLVLTPELFESLATALSVCWPDWYREIILGLLRSPPAYAQRWLPGGFLFASPYLVYEYTTSQRESGMNRWSSERNLEQVPWPENYVIVGHCGDGAIVIDTASQKPILLNLYKEDYTLRPFIDLAELKKSPSEFAEQLSQLHPR